MFPVLRTAVFVLALSWCAPAATLQQLSVDQMTQAATAIVRARVTGTTAGFTGSTIYTHYQLQVTERWKGFAAAEVAVPGGQANGYRQTFPGMPQLAVGTEYVMFLWTSSSTGITHLVGLSQGLFNLSDPGSGSQLATRPPIGEMMLDATGRRVTDQAVQMSVTGLKGMVSHALTRAGNGQ